MIERKRGGIVNIASIGAPGAVARPGPYCASKAGLIQLTRVTALEPARQNVQVKALCPGYFATPMNETFFASAAGQSAAGQEVIMRSIPLRRLGDPVELGPTIIDHASAASRFMTGSVLVIDGGRLLT